MKTSLYSRLGKLLGAAFLAAAIIHPGALRADTGEVDSPAAANAAFEDATTLFKKQKFEQALQRVNDGLAGNENNLVLLRLKGAIQRQIKDNAGAMLTYQKLLDLHPEDEYAANFLNLLERTEAGPGEWTPPPRGPQNLIKAGKLDLAQADIAKMLAANPDDVEALSLKGQIARIQKDYREAIRIYDAILKLNPDNPLAASLQAMVLLEASKSASPDEAFEMLSHALDISEKAPIVVSAYLSAAVLTGKDASVTELYESVKDAQNVDLSDEELAMVASSYQKQENFNESAALFHSLLERNPDNETAASGIVQALSQGGDPKEAAKSVEMLLAKHPDNAELLIMRAKWSAAEGKRLSALSDVTRITRKNPLHPDALNLRIKLLAELGCTSVALDLAKSAPEIVAADVAQALEKTMEESRQQWRQADADAHSGDRDASGLSLAHDAAAHVTAALAGIAYYDVPLAETSDPDATPLPVLIQHLEYLRGNGYTFLSASDVAAAIRGSRAMPERPVLLSFDRAYKSFISNALPILEQYNAPAVLAVSTGWIGAQDISGMEAELMSWDNIKRANQHPLVNVASMADRLSTRVITNPQGRMGLAATSRVYDPDTGEYETPKQYRDRITSELTTARMTMEKNTGIILDMVVWPEGAYNPAAVEIATSLDYYLMFGLADGLSPLPGSDQIILRWQAKNAKSLPAFSKMLYRRAHSSIQIADRSQGLFLDLDRIASTNREAMRAGITALVDYAKKENPSIVYIKGYSDPEDNGDVRSVYFPNSALPLRADILSHVSSMVRAAGYPVHIAMPTLSVSFPASVANESIYSSEFRRGRAGRSTTWFKRLSPFSKEAAELMSKVYSDLAAHVEFDGILFESDGYLTDDEDFAKPALKKLLFELGIYERNKFMLTKDQKLAWSDLKTRQIDEFIRVLKDSVSNYRYSTTFERALLAPSLINPDSQIWLAQNYAKAVKTYDRVIVSVAPESYNAENPTTWMEALVSKAGDFPDGLEKTAFRVLMSSIETDTTISEKESRERLETLSDAGARHLVYTRQPAISSR